MFVGVRIYIIVLVSNADEVATQVLAVSYHPRLRRFHVTVQGSELSCALSPLLVSQCRAVD